jgi:hypothetical protein
VPVGVLVGLTRPVRPATQYLFLALVPAFRIARKAREWRRLKCTTIVTVGMTLNGLPAVIHHRIFRGSFNINSGQSLKTYRDLFHRLHPFQGGWEPTWAIRGAPIASSWTWTMGSA